MTRSILFQEQQYLYGLVKQIIIDPMPLISRNLFHVPIELLFAQAKSQFPQYEYDFKKHQVLLNNTNHDEVASIRLPLHLFISKSLQLFDDNSLVLYVSIASGNAAICVMQGKMNIYHTTLSAYMTRKKQGFSQIKYLNKKGKSRAGSRVRLAGTVEFFEDINTTLTDLFEDYDFDRIAMHCSVSLISHLHRAKTPCPFDKKDERLYKIPLHIPQSNYTNLDATIKKLMAPVLFYDREVESEMKAFLSL